MIKILIKKLDWVFTNNLIVPPKEEWMKIAYYKIDNYIEPIIIDSYLNIDKITPQSIEVFNPTPFDLEIRLSSSLKKQIIIPSFCLLGVNIPSEQYRIYMEISFIKQPYLIKPIEIWINNFPVINYKIDYKTIKKYYKSYELTNGLIEFLHNDYSKEVDIFLVGGDASIQFIDYSNESGDIIYLAGDMAYNFEVSVKGLRVNLDSGAQGQVVVWY